MKEFDLITRYMKPLAEGFPGSLNLTDDAAIISHPPGHELVITQDAITEGIHYLGNEHPSLIARKLLRSNLSDLAAKGAQPICYFLTAALPRANEAFVRAFAEGLAIDQEAFAIHLAGGDTIATQGKPVFSLTAIGSVPQGQMLRRSGAQAGDLLYVSGTLGDSAIGLELLRHSCEGENDEYLAERYLLPQPRLSLGLGLRNIASACMDISDGLAQDLGHLCRASGCGAIVYSQRLPISEAAHLHIIQNPERGMLVLTGGDDYELLFTVPPAKQSLLADGNVTCIGEIVSGHDVTILDDENQPMSLPNPGWQHF